MLTRSKLNLWLVVTLVCVVSMGVAVGAMPGRSQEAQAGNPVSQIASVDTLHINSQEPVRGYSLERAAAYLDKAALDWNHKQWDFNANKKCASCHSVYAYVWARSDLKQANVQALVEVRGYLKDRVENSDSVRPWYDGENGSPKQIKASRENEAVMNALALAWYDARITKSLDSTTRKALDRMWSLRHQPDGGWDWLAFGLNPWESEKDAYAGAALAALATAIAPDDYAKTPVATAGMKALRRYFSAENARQGHLRLHDRVILLWAACHVADLISGETKKQIVRDLKSVRNADGGWDIQTLLSVEPTADSGNIRHSDGYATGLASYVLRQAGLPAQDAALTRSVQWLKANQRASGFWLTPSPNGSQASYLTHMGTAFAVMALAEP